MHTLGLGHGNRNFEFLVVSLDVLDESSSLALHILSSTSLSPPLCALPCPSLSPAALSVGTSPPPGHSGLLPALDPELDFFDNIKSLGCTSPACTQPRASSWPGLGCVLMMNTASCLASFFFVLFELR